MKVKSSDKNRHELFKMLAWIELCGSIGHTCQWFRVGVDGDGEGRLRFEFDDKAEENEFNQVKSWLLDEYNKSKTDLEEISFE